MAATEAADAAGVVLEVADAAAAAAPAPSATIAAAADAHNWRRVKTALVQGTDSTPNASVRALSRVTALLASGKTAARESSEARGRARYLRGAAAASAHATVAAPDKAVAEHDDDVGVRTRDVHKMGAVARWATALGAVTRMGTGGDGTGLEAALTVAWLHTRSALLAIDALGMRAADADGDGDADAPLVNVDKDVQEYPFAVGHPTTPRDASLNEFSEERRIELAAPALFGAGASPAADSDVVSHMAQLQDLVLRAMSSDSKACEPVLKFIEERLAAAQAAGDVDTDVPAGFTPDAQRWLSLWRDVRDLPHDRGLLLVVQWHVVAATVACDDAPIADAQARHWRAPAHAEVALMPLLPCTVESLPDLAGGVGDQAAGARIVPEVGAGDGGGAAGAAGALTPMFEQLRELVGPAAAGDAAADVTRLAQVVAVRQRQAAAASVSESFVQLYGGAVGRRAAWLAQSLRAARSDAAELRRRETFLTRHRSRESEASADSATTAAGAGAGAGAAAAAGAGAGEAAAADAVELPPKPARRECEVVRKGTGAYGHVVTHFAFDTGFVRGAAAAGVAADHGDSDGDGDGSFGDSDGFDDPPRIACVLSRAAPAAGADAGAGASGGGAGAALTTGFDAAWGLQGAGSAQRCQALLRDVHNVAPDAGPKPVVPPGANMRDPRTREAHRAATDAWKARKAALTGEALIAAKAALQRDLLRERAEWPMFELQADAQPGPFTITTDWAHLRDMAPAWEWASGNRLNGLKTLISRRWRGSITRPDGRGVLVYRARGRHAGTPLRILWHTGLFVRRRGGRSGGGGGGDGGGGGAASGADSSADDEPVFALIDATGLGVGAPRWVRSAHVLWEHEATTLHSLLARGVPASARVPVHTQHWHAHFFVPSEVPLDVYGGRDFVAALGVRGVPGCRNIRLHMPPPFGECELARPDTTTSPSDDGAAAASAAPAAAAASSPRSVDLPVRQLVLTPEDLRTAHKITAEATDGDLDNLLPKKSLASLLSSLRRARMDWMCNRARQLDLDDGKDTERLREHDYLSTVGEARRPAAAMRADVDESVVRRAVRDALRRAAGVAVASSGDDGADGSGGGAGAGDGVDESTQPPRAAPWVQFCGDNMWARPMRAAEVAGGERGSGSVGDEDTVSFLVPIALPTAWPAGAREGAAGVDADADAAADGPVWQAALQLRYTARTAAGKPRDPCLVPVAVFTLRRARSHVRVAGEWATPQWMMSNDDVTPQERAKMDAYAAENGDRVAAAFDAFKGRRMAEAAAGPAVAGHAGAGAGDAGDVAPGGSPAAVGGGGDATVWTAKLVLLHSWPATRDEELGLGVALAGPTAVWTAEARHPSKAAIAAAADGATSAVDDAWLADQDDASTAAIDTALAAAAAGDAAVAATRVERTRAVVAAAFARAASGDVEAVPAVAYPPTADTVAALLPVGDAVLVLQRSPMAPHYRVVRFASRAAAQALALGVRHELPAWLR